MKCSGRPCVVHLQFKFNKQYDFNKTEISTILLQKISITTQGKHHDTSTRQYQKKIFNQKTINHNFNLRHKLLLTGCGEKYSKQGHRLGKKVHEILLHEHYCQRTNNKNCQGVLFGEHGNRVNLNLYGIHDQKIITSVLTMVVTDGLQITGGVPITIRFYAKPKEELLGLKAFTASPSIILEVNE